MAKVASFEEFSNGATQVTIELQDGCFCRQVLISNSNLIVAMRGCKELPFKPSDIKDVFQTEEDKNPKEHGGWEYWDTWK